MPANLENSAVATELEKVSFHSNPKERKCKECSNYHTIALISHASKVMLNFLQGRLQQYVNRELPDVEAGFRKGRGTRNQIANVHSDQSLSHVLLLAIPWTAAHQASLSITKSWSLLKLISIETVTTSNHLMLCHPLFLPPSIFPASGSFPMSQFFASGGQSIASTSASVFPMNIQD